MKNTKEIQAILAAIYCINFVKKNKDKDIGNLIDYAFKRCFDSNTNLLTLNCIGHTRKSIMPLVNELLEHETQYLQFIKNKGE